MSDISITRWRRYGKDRLYVKTADGSQLGWHDLIPGQTEVTDEAQSQVVHAAVARWQVEQTASTSQPQTAGIGPAGAGPGQSAVPAPRAEPTTSPTPTPPTVPDPAAPETAATVPAEWEDLAARRAGTMARQQAHALKDAAPLRTLLARILRVHTDERAWRVGANGEEKVAAQLAKLQKRDPR